MAQGSSLYYASSEPTGAGQERELTTGVCYCCKTALASGRGRQLVAAWRHVYPGDLRDIAFAISRDGGRSFSAPLRVSEDGWAINGCPDDGPALVVDASGVTHIVWPTVIAGDEPVGALFYASTRDGQRFTPRVRIPTLGSPKPSHPQMALAADGTLMVAWDELIDGTPGCRPASAHGQGRGIAGVRRDREAACAGQRQPSRRSRRRPKGCSLSGRQVATIPRCARSWYACLETGSGFGIRCSGVIEGGSDGEAR